MSQPPAADPMAAAQAQFQAKIQDRVRESIGDLLPDEVLAGIVREGVKQAFFAPRRVTVGGYHERAVDAEPWVVEFIRSETKNAVLDHLRRWVAENPDEIRRAIEAATGDGLFRAFASAFFSLFRGPLDTLREEIARVAVDLENR
jgi:hypothetical protein